MSETTVSQDQGSWERVTRIGLFVVCVIGVGLRLRAYLFDRSLWLDELFLWSTLGDARLSRAWEPLFEGQVAAPGFVFVSQVMRATFGDSELALRAVPFVLGCLALPLFVRLLRASVGNAATLLGTFLLALSPHAIYYSADFKPYSSDLFVSLALLLAATSLLRGGRGPTIGFALGGVAAVGMSLPASLVLGGCGLVFALDSIRRGDRKAVLATVGASGVWLVTFASMHVLLLSHHHGNRDIHDYWVREGAFPGAGLSSLASYLPIALRNALSSPGGFGDEWGRVTATTYVASALLVLGVICWFRRDPRISLLHVAVLAISLACGAARLYPFSGRVLCFLVPTLVSFVCVAIDSLARSRRYRLVAVILSIGLSIEPAIGAVRRAIHPQTKEEARVVVAELSKRIEPGDVVYLSYWGRFAWSYYAPRFGLDGVRSIEAAWIPVERISEYPVDAAAKLPRTDRVWFFVTHFYPSDDERRAALRALENAGVVEREAIEAPAAAAHRLDLTTITAN